MDVFADKATAGVALRGAIARIGAHAVRTPLLRSDALDKIAGRRVWVKAECLQHSGSFKFRGAWSAISALSAEARARGIIAFSSGNHAQGVAMAAAMHGARAVIIMPEDAPLVKIAGTRALGASVVLYKRESEDREAVANTHNPDGSMCLIKPFDDVNVIAGQASVGAELAEQALELGLSARMFLCRAVALVCLLVSVWLWNRRAGLGSCIRVSLLDLMMLNGL